MMVLDNVVWHRHIASWKPRDFFDDTIVLTFEVEVPHVTRSSSMIGECTKTARSRFLLSLRRLKPCYPDDVYSVRQICHVSVVVYCHGPPEHIPCCGLSNVSREFFLSHVLIVLPKSA